MDKDARGHRRLDRRLGRRSHNHDPAPDPRDRPRRQARRKRDHQLSDARRFGAAESSSASLAFKTTSASSRRSGAPLASTATSPPTGVEGNLKFPLGEPLPYDLIERILRLRASRTGRLRPETDPASHSA